MRETPVCRPCRLAASRVCSVELCEHGVVHLGFSFCTVRVRAEDLPALAATLRSALGQLGESEDARPPKMVC